MKIGSLSNGRIEKPSRKSAGKTGEPGEFAGILETSEAPGAAPSAPANASTIDSLLALQEVPGDRLSREAATRHGQALLEALDRLRFELLGGAVSQENLLRLGEIAASRKGATEDPRLDAVLEEIELRVAVELAKRGR